VPIPFAFLLGIAIGAALAWVSAPELMRYDGPIVASRPFAVATAYAGFVWLPAAGYFVAFHGDWSYLYTTAWQHIPSAIDLGLVLLAGATIPAAFWVCVGWVRARNNGPVLAMAITPVALCAVLALVVMRRLGVSGTYAQYWGEFGTEPIGQSVLGKGVALMGVVVVAGYAWALRAVLRMGAEARS
jgi:hypothetical protein